MVKRHLYQSKHPFDDYAFEAMCFGSWQAVERLGIRDGAMTIHLDDNQYMLLEKGPYTNLRVRSRQATLSDCTCFLRPGVDICAFSSLHQTEDLDRSDSEPIWLDAKISSIERKPHETRCSCEFYVNFYVNKKPLGSDRGTVDKETKVIGIDQIFILQKLPRSYCEGQYYRWDLSEDCPTLPKTKLLLGKFLSDLSWFIVTSALKPAAFEVRSIKKKIVYQILGDDNDSTSLNNYINAVNFKVDGDILVPITHKVLPADTIEACPHETSATEASPFSDLVILRRSKRRNLQPDRFLGCEKIDESEIDYGKNRPYRVDQWEDEEMSLPLSCLFKINGGCSEECSEVEINVHSRNVCEDLFECMNGSSNPKEAKAKKVVDGEGQNQLAIVPISEESEPIPFDHYRPESKSPGKYTKQKVQNGGNSSRNCYTNSTRKVQRKIINEVEDMEFEDDKWDRKPFKSKAAKKKKFHFTFSKGDGSREDRSYSKKRTLSAGAYKDLINSFLKNIDSRKKEEPHIIDQWKQFKEMGSLGQRMEMEEPTPNQDEEEETSENEMLWREMEMCLASSYLEDNECSNAEYMEKPRVYCHHDYKLDEEIGILCLLCGHVSVEIKDYSPPFMQHSSYCTEDKQFTEEHAEPIPNLEEDLNHFRSQASVDTPSSKDDDDNVWALIPQLKQKLHLHQKKGFEFLWKNIAGSLVPTLMEKASRRIGGCVISHTPGAGKTFLMIAFLVSYLKLFPGKRPLVLAPKTTLYTWYKEFIKWEIPVPVYLIHGRRTYRVFRPKNVYFPGVQKPTDDVMHILDCLEKIQKWHAHPSVLVMGYTSFLTLMREDSKFAHRNYMAKVLRKSPGILILDEGHNPRSTKSRLRKCLMKVETDLRVLLSGTLFQNNFCEYFNTLCLARPKFVNEVLKALDPKYKRKKKGTKKAWNLQESRARKFFLDTIAKKVDSDVGEERKEGLDMLKSMTNNFIDVYEGGGESDILPGLQIYTLLMNSADIQKDMLDRLHHIMSGYNGYPLELELLITLGSIHPWLVQTATCANKFFSQRELNGLEKYKFNLKKGSKVKFVMNLVYRLFRTEKILIFCHNIAPIRLFLELFENVFRWQRGREVLVLTGDLELFERGKVMDRFEEPGGPSRILLASITACAEGISLTAASRVIMLDSEWNPSKTKQAIARAFRPGQQKVVYVYQLLATGTLEEDKYRRTTWKAWVSSMIFSEAFVEDPSRWQAEKIEDDILREMVEEDRVKSFHMIMKNEKASTVIRGKD